MSDIVIRVENLTKEYRLGVINHGTLRQDLQSLWARFCGKEDPNSLVPPGTGSILAQSSSDRFYALQDVSFDINEGEIIGIIGRNGAGKSTLLKILSRITTPTSGHVKIRGRVASLLEVGTGFHPELTGRENIFLNGAILGMSRSEVLRKFDEIVAFAEVEKFIDTPVKRYSSGMYVRLAFAVAAHLEPEILVVDEVLAVGDAQFQKKCMGKMQDVGKEGRTVLFVSHNMAAIRNLCKRVVWLKEGQVHMTGDTISISEEYLQHSHRAESLVDLATIINLLPADPVLRLMGVEIMQNGIHCDVALNGKPLEIMMRYEVLQRTSGLRVYFDLCDEERNILVRTFNDDDANEMSLVEPGTYVSKAVIPADLLAPRLYELRLYGTIYNVRSIPPGGISIPLKVEKNNGISRAYPNDPIRSKLLPRIMWQNERVGGAT